MRFFLHLVEAPFILIGFLWAKIFGKLTWSLPPWLQYLRELGKRSPVKLIGVLLIVAGLFFAAYKTVEYYQNRPQSQKIEARITPPEVPYFEEEHAQTPINPLHIEFVFTQAIHPIASPRANEVLSQLLEYPSVAPIEKVGEVVTNGIKISPAIRGKWQWGDDKTLIFLPEKHWPAGQEYSVSFSPEIFDTDTEFTDYEYQFTTPSITVSLETSEFDLSVEEQLKEVWIEYSFSHPVDQESFKSKFSMAYQLSDNKEQTIEDYTVFFSEELTYASVVLSIDELPEQSQIVKVALAKGIKSILGGAGTANAHSNKVLIPDVYSYLKVEQADAQILRNSEQNDIPEQFILLSFTDAIERSEFLNKLSVFALPNVDENGRRKYWQSPREINTQVLAGLEAINVEVLPTPNNASRDYQLRIDQKEGEQLYIKIDAGLRSANGFIQRAFFDKIIQAPEYPKEVSISADGSVLMQSDNVRLPFLTRGLQEVQISIGKVIDNQLNHLVTQTNGDISAPNFQHWGFNQENLAEFTTQFVKMNTQGRGANEASYGSVDLNKLSKNKGKDVGLYFVKISAWDSNQNRLIYGIEDNLLLLITNLGVIVKANIDQSQDVFVQSIKTGQPVQNATVELLGKNGIPLFTKQTDINGHAIFPSVSGFTREQQPSVFVVKYDGDVSFIPFNRYTRQINYSRFDVGGTYDYYAGQQALKAFLFSDRGIYRPGEVVNLGAIVKSDDFDNIDGIPLELVIRDAQYKEVEVSKIKLPSAGFFEHSLDTQSSYVTGNYTASLHLIRPNRFNEDTRDRQIGFVEFSLEEFQADTMSNTTEIEDLPRSGWASQKELSSIVTLQNLFGVPAQKRRVVGNVSISPSNFVFKPFSDYSFNQLAKQDDVTDNLSTINKVLSEATTDADGKARLTIDLSDLEKGTYVVQLNTEGFEPSNGRSVKAARTFLFSPHEHLLGIKKDGDVDFVKLDSERSVHVLAIDNKLEALALDGISVKLSQVDTISTLVKQYNGRYEYQSITKQNEVSTTSFDIDAQPNVYKIDTSNSGTFLVEFIDQNKQVRSSFTYSVVGESDSQDANNKDAELVLKLNKKDYQAGESIELSIQAPYAGSGLITIESNKVHAYKWFTSDTTNSVQSIVIPPSLEGNAYVNVSFVRDHASPEIFTSPLSYAVAPFSIDRDKRTIALSVEVPDVAQPGQDMPITVKLNEDAKLLVYAVDIGILQVANYQTPDPLSYFLQKRALSVRTMQILDLILPSFELVKSLSAAGGDMAEVLSKEMDRAEKIMVTGSRLRRSENPFSRQVRKPVIYWSGIIEAEKGENTLNFAVPEDFAGGLRVMALAVNEGSIGRAQTSNLVVGPFVISPNVLTQAAPNDEFAVTLGVANLVEDSGDNAQLNVQMMASEHLQVIGENNAQLSLDEGEEDSVSFNVKALEQLGAASLRFTVSLTDKSGKTWTSSRTASLSVRPASPYDVTLNVGSSANGEVKISPTRQLYSAQSALALKASVSPLLIADGLTDYLESYPHGCTEQIVSQVFPLIGLSNLAMYSPQKEDVLAQFNSVIDALRQRQSYAGGFSYWPSQQIDDFSTSIYVMHFLLEAQSSGYPVPNEIVERGIAYLENTLNQGINLQVSRDERLVQDAENKRMELATLRERAHAIYLLTRSGRVTSNLVIDVISDLNKVISDEWKTDVVASYIAASYALMQQQDEALALIKKYEYSQQDTSYNFAFGGQTNGLIFDAQHLFILAKHFPKVLERQPKRELSGIVANQITQPIIQGDYNTISAAYSILALGAYHGAVEEPSSEGHDLSADKLGIDELIQFMATNKAQQSAALTPSYTPFAGVTYPIDTLQVSAQHKDGKPIYYIDLQAGYDNNLATEAVVQGLEIQKSFLNSEGEKVSTAKQGDELTVRLRVRAIDTNMVQNAAIVDLLPGGFEVIRESVNRSANQAESRLATMSTWQGSHIDIREDRVVYYGDINNRVNEITYKVKLTAAGKFTVPPSLVESMYNRKLKGRSISSTFEVLPLNDSANQ